MNECPSLTGDNEVATRGARTFRLRDRRGIHRCRKPNHAPLEELT